MSYLSQGEALYNREDMRFKKSPIKYIPYEIAQSDFRTPSHTVLPSSMGQFDNLRKVSDKAASLRQTINSQTATSLFNRTQAPIGPKPPQFSDFLRQTMNHRPAMNLNNTYHPDSSSSRAMQWNKQERADAPLNFRNPEQMLPSETKSTHLLDNTSSLKQYEKLTEKIDKNKKMIEQLRKNSQRDTSPQFVEPKVYQKRHAEDNYLKVQHDANGFRKAGEEKSYLTPKIDKAPFQSRFDSSPLIDQRKKSNQSAKTTNTIEARESKGRLQNHTHNQSLSVSDFAVGRKLGEGKFGIVNMVVHRNTGGFFALKKIPKSLIKSNLMVEQLSLQVRLQSCLSHRNILSMYGFFDDSTQLYIVLQYMQGGTLFQKLKKESRLTQADTSRCMYEMVEAVEYLHDLGIAHRDIKPENIVISNNVYKLCDFGWATLCNERRKTYCGTFDYVAPEILEGEEYDMAVDLWCLGVLAFELLTGKAPFYNISRKETMKKILNVDHQILKYPEEISRDAKDFIDKLVRKDPNERMKASEALLHPFLKKYHED